MCLMDAADDSYDGGWLGKVCNSSEDDGLGGVEVRRRDWMKVREQVRKYTSFYWDSKTVYVVRVYTSSPPFPTQSSLLLRRICHLILAPPLMSIDLFWMLLTGPPRKRWMAETRFKASSFLHIAKTRWTALPLQKAKASHLSYSRTLDAAMRYSSAGHGIP